MASGKHIIQVVARSGIGLSKLGGINAGSTINRVGASANFNRSLCSNSSGIVSDSSSIVSNLSDNWLKYRQISPNGRLVYRVDTLPLVLGYRVDTLALTKSLEAQGIPSKHAEAMASAMNEVLNIGLKNISQNLISASETEIENIVMAQEAHFGNFKTEVQSSQFNQLSLLQLEIGKLRIDMEKMLGELTNGIDEVTGKQLLDFKIERRRTLDELTLLRVETTKRINNIDHKINALRAHITVAKAATRNSMFKYCIVTFVASAIGAWYWSG